MYAHQGWTALIIAASKGHDKVASSLLAYHADVKATTHDGLTALMTAAYKVGVARRRIHYLSIMIRRMEGSR